METEPNLDPKLVTALQNLRHTAPRNPQVASVKRAAFLAEAEKAARGVSPQPLQRLNGWKALLAFFTVPKKESTPMFNATLTLVIMFSILFGGGVVTVASAQSSMPADNLYPVKLWSEDTRLALAGDQQDQMQLNLEFAIRRMEEIRSMLQSGQAPDEPVLARLQNHLEFALQAAVNQSDNQVQRALQQIQLRLQEQAQVISQLQLQATDPATEQTRARVREMLQLHLGLTQTGIENPDQLREQLRLRQQDRLRKHNPGIEQNQEQNQNQEQSQGLNATQQRNGQTPTSGEQIEPASSNPYTTGTPTPESGYGSGSSQNPYATGTPTPGAGYGPGSSQNPYATGTPTPGTGYGPGSSQNPYATGTPTPNSGYGPGPGTQPTNEPVGKSPTTEPTKSGSGGNGKKP